MGSHILTYLYPDLAVTKRRQPPLCRGVVTGQKVKNKNLIHTHIYTSQPLRHTYSLSPTFILTYISPDKTSFHSLTHHFHSYNLPTHFSKIKKYKKRFGNLPISQKLKNIKKDSVTYRFLKN